MLRRVHAANAHVLAFIVRPPADMAEVAGFQPGGREEAKLVLSRPACMALWAAGGRKGALARLMADMGGLR